MCNIRNFKLNTHKIFTHTCTQTHKYIHIYRPIANIYIRKMYFNLIQKPEKKSSILLFNLYFFPIIFFFSRPQKHVWHGALPNGERSIDTYCDAWHSGARDKFGYASNLLGNKLLDQERLTCDSKLIVLCVEALSQDRRKKRDLSDR